MAKETAAPANVVHLTGRVSGEPAERQLPSGDILVQLRVVVPRDRTRQRHGAARRTQVDTIDVACWTARCRAAAMRLGDGTGVQVEGVLRRRFFSTGSGRASRYEVEARRVRRVALEA